MYRGLSDYLGRTNFFSTPSPGVMRSNSIPFGNFVAPPPRTVNTSGFGGSSQSSVQIIGSLTLTVASNEDLEEEKAPSVGGENV